MFKSIEKEYKKNIKEKKFNNYYWLCAFILILSVSIFKDFFESNHYLIYIILFFFVTLYFAIDYIITTKEIKKTKNMRKNIFIYFEQIEKNKMDKLLENLKKYNFRTKNDFKLAIDYFNSQKTIKVESSYFGWIVSTTLTLSSFIEIAYNNETHSLDYIKLTTILNSSIGIILTLLIPILIINFIIKETIFSKKKLHSSLSEDLAYIYINFDKYKNQLTKN